MAVKHVTQSDFHELLNESRPVLVDFYATWCGPCKMLSPVLDRLALEHGEYVFAKVNVDEESELAEQFGVASIPTLVVLKDGKEVRRALGAMPAARVLSLLEE